MTQIQKMRICDITLMPFTVVMLLSGIQLEILAGKNTGWVWGHIAVGTLFLIMIVWHLFLHFKWNNWIERFRRQKSPVTRWLGIFFVLIIVSGVWAMADWIKTDSHSGAGAVHGKLGFIFILLIIGHTIKRIKSPVLKGVKRR